MADAASKKGGKKAVAAGSKEPKAKSTHPPTSSMVNNAINTLRERGGSSLPAIKKFLAANYKVDVEKLAPFIKKYLKSAVESGKLIQTKGTGASGSFKLSAAEKRKQDNPKATKPKSPSKPKKSNEKKKIVTPKKKFLVTHKKAVGEKKKAAAAKPKKVAAGTSKKTVAGAAKKKTSGVAKTAKKMAAKPKQKAKSQWITLTESELRANYIVHRPTVTPRNKKGMMPAPKGKSQWVWLSKEDLKANYIVHRPTVSRRYR